MWSRRNIFVVLGISFLLTTLLLMHQFIGYSYLPASLFTDSPLQHNLQVRKEELFNKLNILEEEYAHTQNELDLLQKSSQSLLENARSRWVALYKFKQIGYATPLLSTDGANEIVTGGYLTGKLLSIDHHLLFDLIESKNRVQGVEADLYKKRKEIDRIKLQLAACEREFLALLEEKNDISNEGSRKDLYVKSQIELQRNLSILEKRISTRKPVFDFSWTPFADRRGELSLPTDGEIIETFSSKNDASSRSILYNRGVIIKAPRGQGIQAIHEGIVVFAEWLKDYGNVMIIDHGNHYYSLVAHADRLLKKVGDIVKGSEMIATVGNTGLKEEPRLYFEIRHHGKSVDPTEWLAARKSSKE